MAPLHNDEAELQSLAGSQKLALVSSSVVCGTDFSDTAGQAAEVAALFAKRLREPFVLVHAVNGQRRELLPEDLRKSLALYARAQMHDERERLQALEVEIVEAFRAGVPDAVLLNEASLHHARLIVLSAKRQSPSQWLQGSVAEKVAEAARAPTLLVRDSTPFHRWAQGKRRLRVLVGADFFESSEAVLRWAQWLRQIGPCDIVVVYQEPCIAPQPMADLYPPALVNDMMLKTAPMRERYFRERVRKLLGHSRVRMRFEKNLANSDAHLIQLASDERADLIVTGTHSRLGPHSVSRGVLRYAPLNVACVPICVSQETPHFPAITSQPSN